MVYNPPVEVGEDGEPIKDGGVALTHPVNPMRRGAYVEQATRATGWAAMYVLGWLLMRLSCYAGLPDDCNLPSEPLEVLTVLLVLLVFALAQVRNYDQFGWFARSSSGGGARSRRRGSMRVWLFSRMHTHQHTSKHTKSKIHVLSDRSSSVFCEI